MRKLLVHEKGHYDEREFKESVEMSESEVELAAPINTGKDRNFCEFRADTMSYILKNRSKDKN